ncbi:4-hydroxy-tetrahydrodipicolinate reductase [Rossellomorea vietnamensis]|uniref:4-hydroxy-tetrahydrodipicolinate reductase n=2 Tax=Rossellomorea TaxID=2837508 RepID=A0A5D4KHP4_9BACI|nr:MULTISPECIES: 4-hydroxy-tetrahydrodipicolinate reductase [Rossellomorea]TYR76476.1 4-hydroxy-tetrahydrodipicolinate reductase [Rossellomorea vietnamensis]TYS79303.1 4-hydroxy-tetrahydrodipicolinate reductase [Rossellomorea aquimaris]
MAAIKVTIAGPRGRMGREAVKMVESTEEFMLISVLDHKHEGKRLSDLEGFSGSDVPVYTDIKECFDTEAPHVLIDLTIPETGYLHTKTALEYGVRPVVGTTGFSSGQLAELKDLAEKKGLGCIIAPNFAVGAVLMMKFSQMAAKYFSDVEIIELHHDQKLDAPSGTAVKTAEMIASQRKMKVQGHPEEKETIEGARGADYEGMHIHSVRLPGLIAHQQVMFGAEGQSLTIRHDSYNRASFMSGVKVCVDTVMKLDTLVYGLENILD